MRFGVRKRQKGMLVVLQPPLLVAFALSLPPPLRVPRTIPQRARCSEAPTRDDELWVEEDDELWDEEHESMQLLREMAMKRQQVEEIKNLARPAYAAELPGSSNNAQKSVDSKDDDVLWDEDVESIELLEEMAQLNDQVERFTRLAKDCSQRRRVVPPPEMLLQPTLPSSTVELSPACDLQQPATARLAPGTQARVGDGHSAVPRAFPGYSSPLLYSSTSHLAEESDAEDTGIVPWQKRPYTRVIFGAVMLLSLGHSLLPSPEEIFGKNR